MIEIKNSDILLAEEKYIAHQCNCMSLKAAGLAKSIFEKFPWSDVYSNRDGDSIPGTISIKGDGNQQRYVINMFCQYYPGKAKYPESTLDGIKSREKYFYNALVEIATIEDLESIAFPYNIGCGLAGGDWKIYYGKLVNFEKFVNTKYNTKVFLYKKVN